MEPAPDLVVMLALVMVRRCTTLDLRQHHLDRPVVMKAVARAEVAVVVIIELAGTDVESEALQCEGDMLAARVAITVTSTVMHEAWCIHIPTCTHRTIVSSQLNLPLNLPTTF